MIEDAKDKMKRMIDFFEETEIPFTEIRINNFSVILDVQKYIEVNVSRIKSNIILSLEWRMCYLRLYELKQIIENFKK